MANIEIRARQRRSPAITVISIMWAATCIWAGIHAAPEVNDQGAAVWTMIAAFAAAIAPFFHLIWKVPNGLPRVLVVSIAAAAILTVILTVVHVE